jgi:SM-20-related protein
MVDSIDGLLETTESPRSHKIRRKDGIHEAPASPLRDFITNQVDFVCIPDFLPPLAIELLQNDVQALKNLGFGAPAGIASKHIQTARRNVHQIWLQSPGSRSIGYIGGFIEARQHLSKTIESLRLSLDIDACWGILPPEMVELSYLWYQPGASYFRHVDAFAASDGDDGRGYKRTVSMILFLGDPTDDRPWQPDQDGGCLRVYSHDESYRDVLPEPGSLVLFDSASVPHEVLETLRVRACVVGWFNAYK